MSDINFDVAIITLIILIVLLVGKLFLTAINIGLVPSKTKNKSNKKVEE